MNGPAKITIIGLGLIGGSLGKALKKRRPGLVITGVDVKPAIIEAAIELGVIDEGTTVPAEGVRDADLVFLAAPVQAIAGVCREIAPHLAPEAIVTDVCSTKENVLKIMAETLPATARYVGGHPMAGSEKSGLEGVDELLFENAVYILTPTAAADPVALQTVRDTVESLGARVVFLTPAEHDAKVAAVSHLPHLAAAALMNTVGRLETQGAGYFQLAAGGLRDTTRIAAGNSELWCGILLNNEQAVLPLIQTFQAALEEFAAAIRQRDPQALSDLLSRARLWRSQLPTGMKSILPELYELTIAIPDQPGTIGEISTLLGRHAINIIDIEVLRVREGEQGAIRLGFLAKETREKALLILAQYGYKARISEV
ncbi:MAG: prephenate dehydrogenase [Clostridia bacterium]|nr:prephenate dehydrogenase [Clostridia bacterium]